MDYYNEEGTFINPLTDSGFKILFGRESSSDILIGFLNAILDPEGKDPITEITYLDKEKVKERPAERSIIYDIHCMTEHKRRFIVEMQNRAQPYYINRSLFYVARAITEQGKPSDWDYRFVPVCGIFISDFAIRPDETRVMVETGLTDMETGKQFSDLIRLVYIQLPNFRIAKPEDCRTYFERWIYLLST